MPDAPDREQVLDGLKRLSGVFKRLLSRLLSLGIVLVFVLLALAIAVYVFDPLLFQAVTDSPRNAIADRALVFESTTSTIGCVADGRDNATVTTYQFLGAHHLVVSGYVTLPDASYVLTEPTIVERAEGQYVLVVESRPTGHKQGCPGLAHYTAKIQLPYGINEYELVVRHGENRTLRITERT